VRLRIEPHIDRSPEHFVAYLHNVRQ
jgi:hypothetical protein